MQTIEQRLERLESSNGRWRLATLGLVALLAITVFCGAQRAVKHDEVRAKKFMVIGDRGEVLAVLGAGDEGGLFGLFDKKTRPTVSAGVAEGETKLQLYGRGILQATDVLIADDERTKYGVLSAGKEGGVLTLFDKDEKPIVTAGALDGRRLLTVFNAKSPAIQMAARDDTGGSLEVYNRRTKTVASIQCDKAEAGLVFVFDESGQPKGALTAHQ